jgi:hypothetical protein
MRCSGKPHQAADAESEKENCFIEMRLQPEIERGSGRTPLTIAIARHHQEAVPPGRNVGVISDTPPTGFDPILIEAFQLVFENDPACRLKIGSRVMELKLPSSWRDLEIVTYAHFLPVDEDLLDDRRRNRIIAT